MRTCVVYFLWTIYQPEISVTVNIPYGYTSSNAAAVAKNVYRLYYGYTSLDEIECRSVESKQRRDRRLKKLKKVIGHEKHRSH